MGIGFRLWASGFRIWALGFWPWTLSYERWTFALAGCGKSSWHASATVEELPFWPGSCVMSTRALAPVIATLHPSMKRALAWGDVAFFVLFAAFVISRAHWNCA